MSHSIQFTKEGYEKILKEHEELQEKRKHAVAELTTARDMGDRSENGAYIAARRKLSSIDSRIRHVSKLIRFGKVVEREFTGHVDIGCTVVFTDGKENKKEYVIVGGFESDLAAGRLSNVSPLGRSLMGKKVGDIVTVHVPAGKMEYKIVEVKSEK